MLIPAASVNRVLSVLAFDTRQKSRQVRRAIGGMAEDQEMARAIDGFQLDVFDLAAKHVRYRDDHRVCQRTAHQKYRNIKRRVILRHRVKPEGAVPVQHVPVGRLAAILLNDVG